MNCMNTRILLAGAKCFLGFDAAVAVDADVDDDDDMRVCAIKQWIKKEPKLGERQMETYCLWCDIINRAHWIVLVGSDSL